MSHRILVVAAEDLAIARVRHFLEGQGHDVDFTCEPPLAEALLASVHYSLLIADAEFVGAPGTQSDIASFAHRQSSATRVVLITRPVSTFALQQLEERLLEAS
jgi:CheY-like chemotaxis protein